MAYWVTVPYWLKLYYKNLVWNMAADNSVYITFDDGPHKTITPFVLDLLDKYDAKATFFCIGNNVVKHTEVYKNIIKAGHAIGNHTYSHVNGWETQTDAYIEDVKKASSIIKSKLYRPPYGRIKKRQSNILINEMQYKIYMWNIISADFDINLSPQKCLDNVLNHIKPGAIIVFHDSEKAWERMSYALPQVLDFCRKQSWQLKALPQE